MKELRFCGGVNIELANLWTSKARSAHSDCNAIDNMRLCLPVNPEIKLHVKEKRIKHNKCCNFLKSLSSSPSALSQSLQNFADLFWEGLLQPKIPDLTAAFQKKKM